MAARSQRKQAERDDARAVREADRARSVALEDERHEFQLRTLLSLQELTRRRARSTFLVIKQDRATIENGPGYRLLDKDDPTDFENAIDFSHNVARVTATHLRAQLESFAQLCSAYSLPPPDSNDLSRGEALAVQENRFHSLMREATETTELLSEYLRQEIDRHNVP